MPGLNTSHQTAPAADLAFKLKVGAPVLTKLNAGIGFPHHQGPLRKLVRAQSILPFNLQHQVEVCSTIDGMLKDDEPLCHAQDCP